VFVTEYLNVPFDEVCLVLEDAGERILGEVNRPLPPTTTERLTPGRRFPMLRETGCLTHSSRDVASLPCNGNVRPALSRRSQLSCGSFALPRGPLR
jgi:hypothetical protein